MEIWWNMFPSRSPKGRENWQAAKFSPVQSHFIGRPEYGWFFSATGIKVDPDDGLIDLWPYGTIADFAWYIGRMVWGAEEWNQTIEWQRPRSRILWFLGRIQP